MVERECERNEVESHSTESARKPWAAPTMTIKSVDEVTRFKDSTPMDGTNQPYS